MASTRPYYLRSRESRARLSRAVIENRRNKKKQAVAYKGGKCRVCPYDRCMGALQFHHLDPEEKDFNINRAGTWAWSRLVKELDKCILVCANCHAEIHEGMVDLSAILTPDEIDKIHTAPEDGPSILDFFDHSEVAQLVDAVGC